MLPRGLFCVYHGGKWQRTKKDGREVGQNDEKSVLAERTNVMGAEGHIMESVRDGGTKPAENHGKSRLPRGKRHDFSEQITIVIAERFR